MIFKYVPTYFSQNIRIQNIPKYIYRHVYNIKYLLFMYAKYTYVYVRE